MLILRYHSLNQTLVSLPKEAPSNKMLPSVMLAKPAAKPIAAIIKFANGMYLIMVGASN
jgi:hypothetical protein